MVKRIASRLSVLMVLIAPSALVFDVSDALAEPPRPIKWREVRKDFSRLQRHLDTVPQLITNASAAEKPRLLGIEAGRVRVQLYGGEPFLRKFVTPIATASTAALTAWGLHSVLTDPASNLHLPTILATPAL